MDKATVPTSHPLSMDRYGNWYHPPRPGDRVPFENRSDGPHSETSRLNSMPYINTSVRTNANSEIGNYSEAIRGTGHNLYLHPSSTGSSTGVPPSYVQHVGAADYNHGHTNSTWCPQEERPSKRVVVDFSTASDSAKHYTGPSSSNPHLLSGNRQPELMSNSPQSPRDPISTEPGYGRSFRIGGNRGFNLQTNPCGAIPSNHNISPIRSWDTRLMHPSSTGSSTRFPSNYVQHEHADYNNHDRMSSRCNPQEDYRTPPDFLTGSDSASTRRYHAGPTFANPNLLSGNLRPELIPNSRWGRRDPISMGPGNYWNTNVAIDGGSEGNYRMQDNHGFNLETNSSDIHQSSNNLPLRSSMPYTSGPTMSHSSGSRIPNYSIERGGYHSNLSSSVLPPPHYSPSTRVSGQSPSEQRADSYELVILHPWSWSPMLIQEISISFFLLDHTSNFSTMVNHHLLAMNNGFQVWFTFEEDNEDVSTGLSKERVSKSLTEVLYPSDRIKYNQGKAICSVCLEDYRYGDSLGMLNCGHDYHYGCIEKWLSTKNACPICKAPASDGGNQMEIIGSLDDNFQFFWISS